MTLNGAFRPGKGLSLTASFNPHSYGFRSAESSIAASARRVYQGAFMNLATGAGILGGIATIVSLILIDGFKP